jgi:hypothetical protein
MLNHFKILRILHRIIPGALLALGTLFVHHSASALPVTAWERDSWSGFRNNSWSLGEIFTVGDSNITVSSLGAFDDGLDGFITPTGIEVGIFRESDNALLANTFVDSGDTPIGYYRFADIVALDLLANTQYRVVAVNQDDRYHINTTPPENIDSRISWDGYAYCLSTTLTSCNDLTGTVRPPLMANFLLDDSTSAVPVPSTLLLFGLGLAGLGWSRREKSSK